MRGVYVTEGGTTAEVYLGVPYAQPPIGLLRFEYPVPPRPWSDVYNATQLPPWCIQFWFPDDRVESRVSSEDCLHFNLFMPMQRKSVSLQNELRQACFSPPRENDSPSSYGCTADRIK